MQNRAPTIAIEFDSAARRRVARFVGDIEDEHILGTYARLAESPDYDYAADDLVDLTDVTRFDVTSDGLRQVMGFFSGADQLGIHTRLAIVAPADVVYGVSRMYQMLRGDDVPEEIAVFRDMDEAKAWLDAGRADRDKHVG